LARRESAQALQPAPNRVPSLDELRAIVEAMPARTLINRRDRAIVAASCLFGTRASATASLHVGDVDLDTRHVRQDATRVRVKNSKSQVTKWFPIDEPFEGIVRAWVTELLELGCQSSDALFPPDVVLATPKQLTNAARQPVLPWSTEEGVRRAFGRGCDVVGRAYINPHAVRHMLAALGRERCRTVEEEQAWAHNLGHADLSITRNHYAKMTNDRRDVLFETLSNRDPLDEEDKDLLLRFHEHQLDRGTPEFERAERLHWQRGERRKRYS
jgi:integrase